MAKIDTKDRTQSSKSSTTFINFGSSLSIVAFQDVVSFNVPLQVASSQPEQISELAFNILRIKARAKPMCKTRS